MKGCRMLKTRRTMFPTVRIFTTAMMMQTPAAITRRT